MPTRPQAKDDHYGTKSGLVLSEDSSGHAISIPSLLANDDGGNAKKFYGLGTTNATYLSLLSGATVTTNGTSLIYNPNGKFDYLDDGAFTDDAFEYTIRLGNNGVLSTAKVTVKVTGANDKPNGNADVYDFQINTILTGKNVLENDSDVDAGDTLTAQLVSGTKSGTLEFNADGSFTYKPNANFNGNDSFSYKAFDGTAYSEVITVNLYGKGEPAKTSFGATVGGVAWQYDRQPQDYFYYKETFNEAAKATGYSDYEYFSPDDDLHLEGAYESASVYVSDEFHYFNERRVSEDQYLGNDANGTPMYRDVVSESTANNSTDYDGILEFDVREAFGQVSGARLTLTKEYAFGLTYDSNNGGESAATTITLDLYAYAGDGEVTTADNDHETDGVKVGTITVDAGWGSPAAKVNLDAAVINDLLAQDVDYIGFSVDSTMSDRDPKLNVMPEDGVVNRYGYEYAAFFVNNATLDLVYI